MQVERVWAKVMVCGVGARERALCILYMVSCVPIQYSNTILYFR